ncbi:MAG: hypothetical protein M3146_00300 [Thermoproteota archaeon]|nr:hypothetical protein [Thermoproteota archaeon]
MAGNSGLLIQMNFYPNPDGPAKSKTNCCDITLRALISLLIVDWSTFSFSAISVSVVDCAK